MLKALILTLTIFYSLAAQADDPNNWGEPDVTALFPSMWAFVEDYHGESGEQPDIKFLPGEWFYQTFCPKTERCIVYGAYNHDGDYIVVNRSLLETDPDVTASFVVHEMVHTVQNRRNMLVKQPCWAVERPARETQYAWLVDTVGVTAQQMLSRIGMGVAAPSAC